MKDEASRLEIWCEIWKVKVSSLYRPGSLKAVARKTHLVDVQNAGWNKSTRMYVHQ